METVVLGKCPVCRASAGETCSDVRGVPTYDGTHVQRTILYEADELTQLAYVFPYAITESEARVMDGNR